MFRVYGLRLTDVEGFFASVMSYIHSFGKNRKIPALRVGVACKQ